jgi:hypothetical protein
LAIHLLAAVKFNQMKKLVVKKVEDDNNAVFVKGDVIASIMKKDIRLITGIKDVSYEFINLKEQRFQDISGQWHVIEKGSVSSQPIDIVHKHFSILEL